MSEFKYTCKLRNKEIKYRPWKVKDYYTICEAETVYEKRKALVYNCLENPNIPLDIDEYQYVLLAIRNASIPSYKSEYIFNCPECLKDYDYSTTLKDIVAFDFKEYSDITVGEYTFSFTDIRNQKFYEELMMSCDNNDKKLLLNMIMHCKSVNNREDLTAEEILNIINNMNVEEFEKLMNHWNSIKLNISLVKDIKCPHCNATIRMNFDYLPNFFPKSWANLV